jgi:1-deoxyxylulose-5-phosphate synthase
MRPFELEQFWTPAVFDVVERVERFAREAGRTPAELAVAWVLANPAITSALVGVEGPDEIRELARAVEHPITDDELDALTASLTP